MALAGCALVRPDNETAGEGWRPLVNGRDLTNWTQLGSARWSVTNGVIHGGQDGDPKRGGLLATKEQFQDFELQLEFMIDEHGKYNSGVYLRNEPGRGGRSGYQINIGRGAAQEYVGLYTDRWLDKGDENDSIRKKLDWNKLCIYAKGPHIKARLNAWRSWTASMPLRSRGSCNRALSVCRRMAPKGTRAG